jgi:hypothetical protein
MDTEDQGPEDSAEEETVDRPVRKYADLYPPHTNSEIQGNPSKHSAFGSTTDGISNRELSLQNPVKVIRCTAMARSTGKQCGRFAIRGGIVCVRHGGQLENVQKHAAAVVESAKLRLINASDMAVDVLIELAEQGTAEQIRLRSAESILDRAGVSAKAEIDLKVEVEQIESAADRTRKQLAETSARLMESRRLAEEKAAAEAEDEIIGEIIEEDDA